MTRIKTIAVAISMTFLLGACSQTQPLNGLDSDINQEIISPNKSDRIETIVFHYTDETTAKTLEIFQDPKSQVSAHFVVSDDEIYQMVDLNQRAFHAGKSSWGNQHNLNETSIGIEIVYKPTCDEDELAQCQFPSYDEDTIDNLTDLLTQLKEKYPDIKPNNYVGHQDIAPTRKQDPGPKFPWEALAKEGFGAWFDLKDYQHFTHDLAKAQVSQTENRNQQKETFTKALHAYGYPEITPENETQVIHAFQTHFTPWKITDQFNQSSYAVIVALLKKYKPETFKAMFINGDILKVAPTPVDEAQTEQASITS